MLYSGYSHGLLLFLCMEIGVYSDFEIDIGGFWAARRGFREAMGEGFEIDIGGVSAARRGFPQEGMG